MREGTGSPPDWGASSIPSWIPVPLRWNREEGALYLLDQTLLPREERYLRLSTPEEVAEAISSLRVRGAPAIGIAAAYGAALEAMRGVEEGSPGSPVEAFLRAVGLLRSVRPTAVNLGWALDRVLGVFQQAPHGEGAARTARVVEEAEAIAREDAALCGRIGEHGVRLIPEGGAGILTHCNAGALATGGVGTALAPIYLAHARGVPVRVWACETRPLLQGARLTAWELSRAGIPVTVLTDSMAGALLARGEVGLILVGADRVAANGDVANKIGTYTLAVLARHHGIPFYVALPRSTFDRASPTGAYVPLEERAAAEVAGEGGGRRVPEEARVWNPAFDLTPHHLVTAFVTDGGVLRPPFGPAIEGLLAPGEEAQP